MTVKRKPKIFQILMGAAAISLFWAVLSVVQAQDSRLEQFSPREEMDRKEEIRRNPRNAVAWFYLGRYYDFTHRNQEAAQAFQQATLLNPGWAEAFFNLGKMYRVLGRHQEAALALQRATLLKSNYSRAFFYLGLVWINLDRPNEAAAALIKAYDHDPGYFETYFDTTSYGIHGELGDKETILSLVHIIYPVNQQLAHIIYKRWTRHGINLRDFYEVVSGSDKKSEAGYQEAQESGYQEQPLPGYQKPPPAGFRR
ncbi:MAG: tetratricopeptide repeat protein [Desulfobaccales bacterium]